MKIVKIIKESLALPRKRAILIAGVLTSLVIIVSGTFFATGAIAKNLSIGEENAQNYAFADAGVDPASIAVTRTKFALKGGTFVYKVEFVSDGAEYEYLLKASDGSIIKKEVEFFTNDVPYEPVSTGMNIQEEETTGQTADTEQQTSQENEVQTESAAAQPETTAPQQGTQGTAVPPQTTTFVPPATTFVPPATTFVPPATTAPSSATTFVPQPGTGNTAGIISQDEAKNAALANAGLSAANVTFTKQKLDHDDGVVIYEIEFYTATHEYEYEINAMTGRIIKKEIDAISHHGYSGTVNGGGHNHGHTPCIGLDKACSIAVGNAGYSVGDVRFTKTKCDAGDGHYVCEVEFYGGGREYEYKIDARTGEIIEFEID